MANFTSLPTAVRLVAELAELPWQQVLPYYRALQEPSSADREAWMPRSIGRSICPAKAIHIAPLLVVLAAGGHPARSSDTVDWVASLTLNGRNPDEHAVQGPHSNTALMEIALCISNEDFADKINYIRFKRDEMVVKFWLYNESPVLYKFPVLLEKSPRNVRPASPDITQDGRLKGNILRKISKNIKWEDSS